MTRILRLGAARLFGMLWCLGTPNMTAFADVCGPESIVVDTSRAQEEWPAFLGRATGQTFLARDTLIESITVWQVPSVDNPTACPPMRLWLTYTDSAGAPITATTEPLLRGPVLCVPTGTNTGPVKVRHVFDPPFALPRPGLYAFFFQDPCAVVFNLYFNRTDNAYADGQMWFTSRSCQLPWLSYPFWDELGANADLIFEIEFCPGVSTPVKRRTWGELKTIYR